MGSRHELRLVLLRHRGSPVAPDGPPCPDRERETEGEEGDPDTGAPGIGVECVVPPERSEADEDHHDDEDHHPDPPLAPPLHAASLHGEGGGEPVQPERGPTDPEDDLDRSRLGA